MTNFTKSFRNGLPLLKFVKIFNIILLGDLYLFYLTNKERKKIMELKKNLYVGAELEVVEFTSRDIVTSSGETGDSFEWVDKNPNSWDS